MPKVKVDQQKCIGCAACTSVWDNFEIKETDSGFKAIAKKTDIKDDEVELAKEAAQICPVDAIRVKEK